MKIDRDGTVSVPPQDAGTFRDFSLSLENRLDKLALLIGSDEWNTTHQFEAEALMREAALRLRSGRGSDGKRVAAMSQAATKVNVLVEQNECLREELKGLRESYTRDVYNLQLEILRLREKLSEI